MKQLLNFALYGFIAGHLVLLTVYVLPHQRASNALTGLADLYMATFFHQEWDLFAPEPPNSHYDLAYLTFNSEGQPLDTIWPTQWALKRHLDGTSVTATKELYMVRRFCQQAGQDAKRSMAETVKGYSATALDHFCSAHARFNTDAHGVEVLVYRDKKIMLHSERIPCQE